MQIRDIILNEEELINHARELAREHNATSKTNKYDKAVKKMNDAFESITSVYRKLNDDYKQKQLTVPASEWLLDNFYIIEENAKQIKRDFKKKLYINLPVLANGENKGFTRIFAIADEIVAHNDGKVDEKIIEKFINSYEAEQSLYMREIWSLGLCLRIALIARIGVISEKIYETHIEWTKAESWIAEYNPNDEIKLPVVDLSINPSFLEHLSYKLRRNGKEGLSILNRIDSYIERYGINIEAISHKEHSKQAGLKISIGNCILSLKYIANIDWNDLFNQISVIEQIFENEPAKIYPDMDLESKNAYRARVQNIANAFGISEVHVAKKCIECASKIKDDKTYEHVGYYLWGEGQEILERSLDIRMPKLYKLKREIINEPFELYISLIFLSSFITTLVFYFLTSIYINTNIFYNLGIWLSFIIAVDGSVCFINYILNRVLKPRIIPRMDFKDGIPEDCCTMVIVPTLLSSEKRVNDMLDNIEKYYIAANNKNVYFTLVGDAKESKDETIKEDDKIAEIGLKRIEKLNQKYDTNNFFFVYRKRFYNRSENKWLGWERKRGAIIKFNELLLNGDTSDYRVVSKGFDNLPEIKYVLTVDADTCIPIGEINKLIGAMAHPFNKPILNDERNVVKSGYGIIQPHIGIDVVSANKSEFSRTFAGAGGIDPYICASSDIYQDLFGEAIFTGKGIYDLKVFQEVLKNTIPENSVLSHDLIEGSYLRVGLATDVELVDGYPARYNAYAMRAHRWARGDWQITPWLFKKVKNQKGEIIKNPINKISKWKIFDNLRRSITAPIIMLMVFLSFSVLPGSSLWWVAFALILGMRGNKKQFLYQTIFIAFKSWLMVRAIIKTLYRIFFTKKNFLEWVTAADMESKLKNTVASFYSLMNSSVIQGVIILILTFIFKRDIISITTAEILSAMWILAPFIAYKISKDKDVKEEMLTKEEIEQLKVYANKTWGYFDSFMNEKNNFLPPDNYQEDPQNGIAYRTSPTNIGLGMLAMLSAYDLGFIDYNEMIERIEKILNTINRLEKWNGHLLNWYNTKTLKPLFPRYISTVDSGNLLAYCITLKSALEHEKSADAQDNRIEQIIDRLAIIIREMKFDVLFDKKKNVFSIGFNLEEGRLTNSYYDLFASESRQISFLAIARHEVPIKHWFSLGRNLTKIKNKKGLISWTGTMFEYLMPLLLMKNYKETLLDETYEFVVKSQIDYGKKKNVVWGISESAFYSFDINLNYQYKALGVPWLGLKRGLINDTVISPYSTMLALMVKPKSAFKNLKELEKFEMLGKYGFYESVDFTPGRLKLSNANMKYAAVKSYMAHHQGMSLVAMNNVINKNIMQERFHNDVYVKSAELLLQEKVPGDSIYTQDNKEKVVPPKELIVESIDTDRFISKISEGRPNIHVITNGSYFTAINDRGLGFSKYRNIFINRYRGDYILENSGQIFYIKCMQKNQIWAASYEPFIKKPDKYSVIFSGDKVKISRRDGMIETNEEIVVSTEDNTEIRRITIINHSEEDLDFEVTGYLEVVLGSIDADISHRTFYSMFVNTDIKDNVIIAKRRERNNQEGQVLYAGSFAEGNEFGNFQFETDRASFIGRGKNRINPSVIFKNRPLKGTVGAVLDPIIAQRRYLKVKAKSFGRINFIIGVAETIDMAIETSKKYLSEDAISRTFRMAFARNQVEMSYLNVNAEEVSLYEDLMRYIIN